MGKWSQNKEWQSHWVEEKRLNVRMAQVTEIWRMEKWKRDGCQEVVAILVIEESWTAYALGKPL